MDDIEDATRAVAERWFHEVWEERNLSTVEELWGAHFVASMEGLPPVTLDDFLSFARQLFSAFSDLRIRVVDMVVEGDTAFIAWRLTGTHDGVLVGIPPSGRAVEEFGMTKFRVKGGKIVEGRDSWNFGAMLDRLSRPSAAVIAARHGLTPRQAEVALLLADRLSTKEIAKRLEIRVNTARRHVQAVLRRLQLSGRDQVADAIGKVEVRASGPHAPDPVD